MRILLARHGETAWNAEGRYQGQEDIALSPIGEAQARALGERLRDVRIDRAVSREGMTLVPLRLYFKGGRVKVELGLAKGKKTHDKRASEKERDWQREKQRTMRAHNKNA